MPGLSSDEGTGVLEERARSHSVQRQQRNVLNLDLSSESEDDEHPSLDIIANTIPTRLETLFVCPESEALAGELLQDGICSSLYSLSGNSKPLLLAMCIGLKSSDGKRDLADFDNDDLYKHLHKKMCPVLPEMKKEMKRRYDLLKLGKFRKNSVPRPEALKWLIEHPVTEPIDVDFLRAEEGVLYDALKNVAAEEEARGKERLLNSNWVVENWVRFIECMIDDESRTALLNHDKCMERDELDARNNGERPETYPEVVCRLYNDTLKTITSEILPELHADFAEQMILCCDDLAGGELTVEECKKKIGDLKAKTTQVRCLN